VWKSNSKTNIDFCLSTPSSIRNHVLICFDEFLVQEAGVLMTGLAECVSNLALHCIVSPKVTEPDRAKMARVTGVLNVQLSFYSRYQFWENLREAISHKYVSKSLFTMRYCHRTCKKSFIWTLTSYRLEMFRVYSNWNFHKLFQRSHLMMLCHAS
jgi:hypothetical protein